MIKLIIMGACGRVGATLVRLGAADPAFTVSHTLEVESHPLMGTRIDVPDVRGASFVLETDLANVIDDGDVVIDFTEASASLLNFKIASEVGKAIVVGTTGVPLEIFAETNSGNAKAVISPNFSVAVNVLFDLVERTARILGPDYDTEILEMHHRWKKDAPSGTALRLRDAVMGTDKARSWVEVTGRQGMIGERKRDEVGLLSLRGGDVVGEHTVLFAGMGERLEITHRAYSRENFARGALLAAKWIVAQKNGIYDMSDVLGLRWGR